MASKYTKLLRSIWTNDDFTALDVAEQRLFMLLFSQPNISACGVLPLMERRWARLAPDTDADSVRASLCVLATCPQPFIVVDEETDEVWVRSYLTVDEMYKVPNGRKAIDAALSAVMSPLLRPQIERVYETLSGTLNGTHKRGDRPPQQQAASTKHPSPDTGSSSATPDGPTPDASMPAAAAAALEIYVAHRLATEDDVRSPARYATKIRTEEKRQRAPELTASDPDSDPVDLAVALFGITRRQAMTAAGRTPESPSWCDTDCPTCDGDAWIDTGNGLAPCPQRKAS